MIEWAALGIEALAVSVTVAGVIIMAVRRGTVHYLFNSAAIPGLLVLVRTILSWSLVVEMEGRSPWQGKHETPNH